MKNITALSCHRVGKVSVRISIVRSEKIGILALFICETDNSLIAVRDINHKYIVVKRSERTGMSNPITCLTKKEWAVWLGALLIIVVSNIFSANFNMLTLVASCVGVTSLIIAAKGNVWSQILMILFSILYGIISWQFHYWGEMMTYLGMTMPMAIWSTITWIRNPSESGKEVEIQQLTKKHIFLLATSATVITILFFKILAVLETPNIVFSTISITTSFLAASLTMLRSSYYAVGYAANDIVLIVLWIMATLKDPSYFSVTIIFIIFFFFDLYGFVSWRKREAVM